MNSNTFLFVAVGVILLFLLLSLGLLVFGPSDLPIWYSLSLPEQQLDQKITILVLPFAAIISTAIHYGFAKRVRTIDASLEKLFLYASAIPIIILAIACIHIVTVVL